MQGLFGRMATIMNTHSLSLFVEAIHGIEFKPRRKFILIPIGAMQLHSMSLEASDLNSKAAKIFAGGVRKKIVWQEETRKQRICFGFANSSFICRGCHFRKPNIHLLSQLSSGKAGCPAFLNSWSMSYLTASTWCRLGPLTSSLRFWSAVQPLSWSFRKAVVWSFLIC